MTVRISKTPISVVLPIRNRTIGIYTLQFLDGQLETGDELLLSFNKTSEEVKEAILECARKIHGNVKFLCWNKLVPIYPHWKLAIEAASHDAILFVHDDDVYHGRILKIFRDVLDCDVDAAFVTSQMINVGLLREIDIRSDGLETEPICYNWQSYFDEKRHRNFIAQFNTSFYGFRRSKLGNLSFLEKDPVSGDFMLFYAGLLGGNLYVLPEFLAARLQHGSNAVYNEFFKTGHSSYVLNDIFRDFHLDETPAGKFFLNHARQHLIRCYKRSWRMALMSGIEPKKLVVVFRRLRMLDPQCDLRMNHAVLKVLFLLRKTNYWKYQNRIYQKLITIFRRLRGPSSFYRLFPSLTVEQFTKVMEQPPDLVERYIRSAYINLGSKK